LGRGELDLTEELAAHVNAGATNYSQDSATGLGEPRSCRITVDAGRKLVRLYWDSALAGANALRSYEILRDGKAVATVAHKPQLTLEPFVYEETLPLGTGHRYEIAAIDVRGTRSVAPALLLESAAQ
jgi:hypothetical protein